MPRPTQKPDVFASDESDMFVQLSPLDYAKKFIRNPTQQHERHPRDFTPPSCSIGIDRGHVEQPIDHMHVAFAFSMGMVTMMAQPHVHGGKDVKLAQHVVQATPEKISPSLDEGYLGIDQDAIKRKDQGQPSSRAPNVLVSDDVVRSPTPSSVRHVRVVHPPPMEDF
ncbi:hypothetical protein ZWY2020_039979 [Hordeum vulgare]|nr:hypothetical protein ZWY2020_039979 [Hordeum vulgare]